MADNYENIALFWSLVLQGNIEQKHEIQLMTIYE